MGIIKVKNIRVYSYHGCLDEEGKIGSEYRVDLSVKADLKKSAKSDQLNDTVDYVHLNKIVKEEMAIRSKLIESVGQRIIKRLKNAFERSEFKVVIKKLNPPICGVLALIDKRPPTGLRGTNAKSQERHGGLGQNPRRHRKSSADQHGSHGVGQHMAENRALVGKTQRLRSNHKFLLPQA